MEELVELLNFKADDGGLDGRSWPSTAECFSLDRDPENLVARGAADAQSRDTQAMTLSRAVAGTHGAHGDRGRRSAHDVGESTIRKAVKANTIPHFRFRA